MALIKKNIWFLFYTFLIIGLIASCFIIYSNYKNTLDKIKTEQGNITKITANSMYSVLLQYETVLDILSSQITKNEKMLEENKIIETYDKITLLNKSIVGIGSSNKEGKIYLTSSSSNNFKLKNLLKDDVTKSSFIETISSNKMVVGRTYYSKNTNRYIVPLRKVVKNKNDEFLTIITMAIDLEKGFDFFLKNSSENPNYNSFIFRDLDYYFQLAPSKYTNKPNIYEYQIEKKIVESQIKKTEQAYNLPIKIIKKTQMLVFFENKDYLSSSKYLSRYELWFTTQFPKKNFYKIVKNESFLFTTLFIIVTIILFFLFKNIDQAEKRKTKALEYQANHDFLTGLKNRQYLSSKIEKNPLMKSYSIFFIDIDSFKNINDSFGHNFGDELLKQISQRLNSLKNKNQTIIRYSGDEFFIIDLNTQKSLLENKAKDILDLLNKEFTIEKNSFNISVSIGISSMPKDAKSFDELKRAADIAMYEAKKTKNSYYFYNNQLKEKYLSRVELEDNLLNAVKNNEIFLMYQPQVNHENSLYGVEALARWANPNLGFVPPDIFIKTAEEIGFINTLGEYIIETSLKEISILKKELEKEFHLSINISLKQFLEKNFLTTLRTLIKKYNFDTQFLTLELTENIFIEDIEEVLTILNELKNMGITISLDDFGTEYSSLNILKKLPIDELKIDKCFVEDILSSKSSANVVKSIISIGKEFDMNILCEGIEYLEQKNSLQALNCDLFQGYYFAKPLQKEALIEYIKKEG